MNFVAEVFRAALGLFTTEQLQNIPTYLDCDALFYGVADAQLVMTADGLLNALFDHSESPEFVYEHEWQIGDLLLWDNRCSMHARTDFPETERRLLLRTTVVGDAKPF